MSTIVTSKNLCNTCIIIVIPALESLLMTLVHDKEQIEASISSRSDSPKVMLVKIINLTQSQL